jgi:glycosyltransferase involved in cell wall biosynthesis
LNILFLSQVLPYPLDAGPKVRSYYVLRQLAQTHRVTLAAFVRDTDTPEAQAHLRTVVAELAMCPLRRTPWGEAAAMGRSAISGTPVLITRDHVPDMSRLVGRLAASTPFDAIHADQLWMAPYALAAGAAAGAAAAGRGGSRKPRLVLDQHNAVHLIPGRLAESARNPVMRLGWQRETRQMARYEAGTCAAFDRVVTVTNADRQALRGLYVEGGAPDFKVIPICVDVAASQPRPRASQPGLLFLAGMHWPPNADGVNWFADEILPAVRAQAPSACLLAVGRQPPASLRRAEVNAFIEAPGYVDNVEPYWARSQVFVVPLRAGGGMRVKILDAWAQGVPVVSTTIGAEGLTYQHGQNILIADTPQEFAQAINAILQDSILAQRLAAAGRANVEAHYDWRRIYPAWDALYAD